MRAIVFDPYLDTLGGGERYSLEFAQSITKLGYTVEVAWNNIDVLKQAEKRFGLDLSLLKINPPAYALFFNRSSLIERYHFTHQYDLVFWLSDGSLPFLFSKNNLVHFQTPFTHISGNYLLNFIKTILIKQIIYNSNFTKAVIQRQLPFAQARVIYPPVDVNEFQPAAKKDDLILSVARFDSPSHAKRQDILLEAFKLLHKQAPEYKLILAGGVMGDAGESDLAKLKKSASGLSVEFVINPDFNQLKKLYSRAKFFWHAAGYEIDEKTNPEKVEHFGITTVEAMAAGCVPIVINKGGQKETVTPDSGRLVNSIEEIVSATLNFIADPTILKESSRQSIEHAANFSRQAFQSKVRSLI